MRKNLHKFDLTPSITLKPMGDEFTDDELTYLLSMASHIHIKNTGKPLGEGRYELQATLRGNARLVNFTECKVKDA